jgi:ABC-type multidrug transport system fused ATPase/permease subunit
VLLKLVVDYCSAIFRQQVFTGLRLKLFKHLQSLSLRYYQDRETGQLMSRSLDDVGNLGGVMKEGRRHHRHLCLPQSLEGLLQVSHALVDPSPVSSPRRYVHLREVGSGAKVLALAADDQRREVALGALHGQSE